MPEKYTKLKKSKVKNSEIDLEVEISAESLEDAKKKVLSDVKKDFAMPGFRKGMVPENIVLQNINQDHLLHEAAEVAVRDAYEEIVRDADIEPITPPKISILKLALGNPLELKLEVGVYPEVDLPNYKKIALKIWEAKEKTEITDKEVEDVIAQFRKMRQSPPAGGEGNPPVGGPAPELTDEEVKSFGPFETVADFKTKLRENLLDEKTDGLVKQAHDKMIREIVSESKLHLPELLVKLDLADFKQEFETRLEETGETVEKYLERAKKTAEEVEKDQRDYVERSLKTKFVLTEILKKENIKAEEADIATEAAKIKNYRSDLTTEQARAYAESSILNDKLFTLLEGKQ